MHVIYCLTQESSKCVSLARPLASRGELKQSENKLVLSVAVVQHTTGPGPLLVSDRIRVLHGERLRRHAHGILPLRSVVRLDARRHRVFGRDSGHLGQVVNQ